MPRRLTARQQEIALLLADGLTNQEIAERLVLAEGTVANHIENMLSRTGFRNRTQLAVWAALKRHGIDAQFSPPGAPRTAADQINDPESSPPPIDAQHPELVPHI